MNKEMCPKFESAMEIVGQRWVGLIIYQLLEQPLRFKDLEESIGVSAKVLSDRLKLLEKEGIIIRKVYPETPVLIEYSLSEKGKSMNDMFSSIQNWADTWL